MYVLESKSDHNGDNQLNCYFSLTQPSAEEQFTAVAISLRCCWSAGITGVDSALVFTEPLFIDDKTVRAKEAVVEVELQYPFGVKYLAQFLDTDENFPLRIVTPDPTYLNFSKHQIDEFALDILNLIKYPESSLAQTAVSNIANSLDNYQLAYFYRDLRGIGEDEQYRSSMFLDIMLLATSESQSKGYSGEEIYEQTNKIGVAIVQGFDAEISKRLTLLIEIAAQGDAKLLREALLLACQWYDSITPKQTLSGKIIGNQLALVINGASADVVERVTRSLILKEPSLSAFLFTAIELIRSEQVEPPVLTRPNKVSLGLAVNALSILLKF